MSEQWWRDAVIYQVYPRSFADANGDGVGDIAGIRSRLAHIAGLGADALWISPFYTSPMNDAGYDVADFRDIDPVFGTVAEVEALIAEAHDLDLRVVIDIVPNHTSSEHAWFHEALAAGPPSDAAPERTRWSEGPWSRYHLVRGADGGASPPNNWTSNFGGPAWTQLPLADGTPSGWWYLHLFDPTQPDLDWGSTEVREEFHDILRFWFDRGVDGFRIDVAHGLCKEAGYPDAPPEAVMASGAPAPGPQYDQPEVHDVFRGWRAVADEYDPPKVFVGEVWVSTPERLAAYLRPDELHTAFNFDHLRTPWWAQGLRQTIDHSLAADRSVGAPTTWVLENHDVWRAPTRYAPLADDPDGTGFAGLLGARVAEFAAPRDLVTGLRRARAALLVMLALPGSAYLYQGQELGLFEVLDLPDEARQDPTFRLTGGLAPGRDGCRVPVPWSGNTPSFGFGPDGSTASWLPQPPEWAALSVAAQSGVEGSTLELTRAALALRRSLAALGDGELVWDDHELGRTVLSFLRPARDGGHALRCVVAMEGTSVALPPGWGGPEAVLLASDGALVVADDGALVLPTDTAVWLRA